jgi:hypothetical protein
VKSDSIAITDADPTNVTVTLPDNLTINSATTTSVSENATVTITATDNFVVKSYFITTSSGTIPTTSSSWIDFNTPGPSENETVNFNLSNLSLTSNLSLYVWLRDNSSNITDNYTADSMVLLDNASPVITSITVQSPSGDDAVMTGDNASVVIAAADLFGVQSYFISDNASDNLSAATFTNFSSPATSISSTVQHTFNSSNLSAGDTLTLYVWVRDADNNTSSVGSDGIYYHK